MISGFEMSRPMKPYFTVRDIYIMFGLFQDLPPTFKTFVFSPPQFSPASLQSQPIFSQKKSGVLVQVFLLQHLFQLRLVIFHDLLQDHSITKELQFLHFNVHFSFGSEQ